MAFENLLIRTNKNIGGIVLDAVVRETTSSTLRITKNPIELGADINDHAIIEPKEYSLEAVITDTPLFGVGSGNIINQSNTFGSTSNDNQTRSQAAYESLILLQESREPLTIQTGLKQFKSMLISNITVIQDKDTSKAIHFTAKLMEVIQVDTEEIEFPKEDLEADTTQQQGSSPINEGQKNPVDASANTSILGSAANAVGF